MSQWMNLMGPRKWTCRFKKWCETKPEIWRWKGAVVGRVRLPLFAVKPPSQTAFSRQACKCSSWRLTKSEWRVSTTQRTSSSARTTSWNAVTTKSELKDIYWSRTCKKGKGFCLRSWMRETFKWAFKRMRTVAMQILTGLAGPHHYLNWSLSIRAGQYSWFKGLCMSTFAWLVLTSTRGLPYSVLLRQARSRSPWW